MHGLIALRDVLPGSISVLAVVISALSLVRTGRDRERDVHTETVGRLYGRFHELQALTLQHPSLSHLFTGPRSYDAVRGEVAAILRHADDRERAEHLVMERAAAAMLFSLHEQVIFQWAASRRRERAFMADVIDYLETRLFRNPRLVWWWTAEGIGLAAAYETLTKERWERRVLSGVDRARPGWHDPDGPLLIGQQGSECRPDAAGRR